MKKTATLTMALLLGFSTTAFAANPFSDVPKGHWAYGAVAQLASEGVVSGYNESFKGNATMTRYEMAQIVAKALAKGVISENDALVAEFADELNNLGVRVSKLEEKSDNIKVTGNLRYRYYANKDYYDKSKLRTRIGISGKVNDDWTYNALVENNKSFGHDERYSYYNEGDDDTNFSRAWLEGKVGQTYLTVGRFNYIAQNDNNVITKESNVFDDELDGIKVSNKFGSVNLSLTYGRQVDSTLIYNNNNNDNDIFIATIDSKIGAVDTSLGYYYKESTNEYLDKTSITSLNLSGEVISNVILSGAALKGSKRAAGVDDFGYVLGLKYKKVDKNIVGSYSLSAKYYNQPLSTYINPSLVYSTDLALELVEIEDIPFIGAAEIVSYIDGLKGYRVGVDYTVAKNVIASIYYLDIKGRNDTYIGTENEMILSQMKVFF